MRRTMWYEWKNSCKPDLAGGRSESEVGMYRIQDIFKIMSSQSHTK